MKKYILAIIVNILLAAVSTAPMTLGLILINGIFTTPPPAEQLKGWLTIAATVIVALIVNTIIYIKKYKGNLKWFIPISIVCWVTIYGIAMLLLIFS